MSRRAVVVAAVAFLLAGSGCAGLQPVDPTTTVSHDPCADHPACDPTATTTTATTTTATTERTPVLTDRTPATRLEIHPDLGFTGTIAVEIDGERVFDRTYTDYDGFGHTDLSRGFHDDAGANVVVLVNGSASWERWVGETEGYELAILQNGTVEVRSRIVG